MQIQGLRQGTRFRVSEEDRRCRRCLLFVRDAAHVCTHGVLCCEDPKRWRLGFFEREAARCKDCREPQSSEAKISSSRASALRSES